jgi:hypothetical protein
MNTPRIVYHARNTCLRLLVTCCICIAAINLAHGAAGEWTGTSEVAYLSDYVYRGARLAGDSIQPSISTSYTDKLTFSLTGIYGIKKDSLADPTGNGRYSETDFYAAYRVSHDIVTLTLGGTLYRIDDLFDPETGKKFKYYFESTVALTARTKFNPTITFWRAYGRLDTNLVEFSLSDSFELNKQCRLIVRPYVCFIERGDRFVGLDVSAVYDFGNKFYGRATVTANNNNYEGVRNNLANFSVGLGRRW